MEAVHKVEKSIQPDEKTNDLEKAPTRQEGVTFVSSGVDDAGFRRQLGKRQIMMMTFGAGIGTGLWASRPTERGDLLLTSNRLVPALPSNMPDQVALLS